VIVIAQKSPFNCSSLELDRPRVGALKQEANLDGGRQMNVARLRKSKVVSAEFEFSESTEHPRSSKSREEQVWDEQARSRMDDEGCPDSRQQRDQHEDGIGTGIEGS
jgi:hypothetical protein